MRRGIVLLFSLFLLVLLAFLSLFFLVLATIQKQQMANWKMEIQAGFLAHSGIEYAVTQLRKKISENPFIISQDLFLGEDLNQNGLLDEDEDTNKNGILDISSASLAESQTSSFATHNINIDNRFQRAILFEQVREMTSVIKLKVIDASSKINISNNSNSGLTNLLKNLSIITNHNFDREMKLLEEMRAGSSSESNWQGSQYTNLLFRLQQSPLSNFITLDSWVDTKVIKPSPAINSESGLKIGDFIDSLNQIIPSNISLEPRSPINLNTAPFEVLFSVLNDLEGTYVEANTEEFPTNVDKFAQAYSSPMHIGKIAKINISTETAKKVASAIIKERTNRHGFKSWEEFQAFLSDKELNLSELEVHLILANCLPNSDLNKFNPDSPLFKFIDKSDLVKHTTEFTLFPTGYFEIESLGLITLKNRPLAQKRVTALVKIFDIYRDTTQSDFAGGKIQASKLPNPLFSTYKNKTLEILPEPDIKDFQKNATYDGYITRRTLSYNPLKKITSFSASFDNKLEADFALGKKEPININYKEFISPFISKNPGLIVADGVLATKGKYLSFQANGNILFSKTEIEKLEDKAMLESICDPIKPLPYTQKLKVKSETIVSFWVKPSYNFSAPRRITPLFSIINTDSKYKNVTYKILSFFSYFSEKPISLFEGGKTGINYFMFYGEIPLFIDAYSLDEKDVNNFSIKPNVWNYIFLGWNLDYSSNKPKSEFYISNTPNSVVKLQSLNSFEGVTTEELPATLPTFFNSQGTLFTLGSWNGNYPTMATFDELNIFFKQKDTPLPALPRFYYGEGIYNSRESKLDSDMVNDTLIAILTVYNGKVNVSIENTKKESRNENIDGVFYFKPLPNFKNLKYKLIFPHVEQEQVFSSSEIVDDISILIPVRHSYLKYYED